MKIINKIKKYISDSIIKLGKANQKNLGSAPLDCCSLNKNSKK